MNQFYFFSYSHHHLHIFIEFSSSGFRLFANKLQEDTIIGKFSLLLLFASSFSYFYYSNSFRLVYCIQSVYLLRMNTIHCCCCCYFYHTIWWKCLLLDVEKDRMGREMENIKRKVLFHHQFLCFSLSFSIIWSFYYVRLC